MEVNLLGKLKVRRGTSAERMAIVLDDGEPAWDVDLEQFFVGDGVTQGGVPIANKSDLNLGSGLVFTKGNGRKAILGQPIEIGMESPVPVRLVSSMNINSPNAQMSLTMNNVKLVYTYYDKNNSKAWIQTVTGTEVIDFRRMTVYNAAFDVNSYDGYTLTPTPLNFDVLTYDDSNETTDIVIREQGRVWNVRVFLSANGERSTMWAQLVYDPEQTYATEWHPRINPGPTSVTHEAIQVTLDDGNVTYGA